MKLKREASGGKAGPLVMSDNAENGPYLKPRLRLGVSQRRADGAKPGLKMRPRC